MSQQTETTNNATLATNQYSRDRQLPVEPTFGDVAEQTLESIREYAKQRPDVMAMWCFGIGFVVGWKLKPW